MPRRRTPKAVPPFPRCPGCQTELRHLVVETHRLTTEREEWLCGADLWRRHVSAGREDDVIVRKYYCFTCDTRLTAELHEWARTTVRTRVSPPKERPR